MKDFHYQSASDLHLTPRQRAASVLREPGIIGATTHRITRRLLRGYLRAAHRLRIDGLEHLPPEPPCILICNHTSHLDALALTAALPARWCPRVYPLAADDVFFKSLGRASLASLTINALPVDREHGRRHAIRGLRDRLTRQRCVYLLFPEGTRSADGTLNDFKPGLGMLVAGADVPVIPCHLDGPFRCWPRHQKLPRPGPLHLRLGQPLYFKDTPNHRAGWEQVVHDCTQAVAGLENTLGV